MAEGLEAHAEAVRIRIKDTRYRIPDAG